MKEGSTNLVYREYWVALRNCLESAAVPFNLTEPPARDRYTFALGRTGFKLEAVLNSKENWIRVQVALVGPKAAPLFSALKKYEFEIEPQIGESLEWAKPNQVPFARLTQADADPLNRKKWPQQHGWIAKHLVKFHKAFAPIIRRLPIHKS